MNLSIKAIPRFIPISLIVIGICVLPLLFSGGCNFDPYEKMSSSDTVTYKISGIVKTKSNKEPIPGISVCLSDSMNLHKSPYVSTDISGKYDITWTFLRRNTLYLKFEDFNSKDSLYRSDSVDVSFDADYFKYGFQKNQDRELDLK